MFLDFTELAAAALGAEFDPFDAAGEEWLQTHAFELVQGVTETTVNELRRTLAEGWEAGEGIPELAARVREVFEEADRYRSFLIARTETTATANMAQLSVLRQAGIGYKTWSTSADERVCPVCGPLDGRTVRLDEEFAPGIFAPPAHPNCRCTTLARTELDEVAVRKYPGQPRDRQGRFAPGKQPQELPSGVYPAGALDPSKVKAVAEVDTDQVVLTPERAGHIMRKHPGFLERYGDELPRILARPDIVARRRSEPQVAHLVKRNVGEEGVDVEVVVWLHTAADRPGHANAIVTAFDLAPGSLERRLEGMEVVYRARGS